MPSPAATPPDKGDAHDQGLAALLAGEAGRAVAAFRRHLAAAPQDTEARYWLASALIAAGATAEAETMLAEACTFHAVRVTPTLGADPVRMREDAAYAAEVARQLYAAKLPALANAAVGQAMSAGGVTAELLWLYGLSFQHQGRAEEAIRMLQAAADAFPSPGMHQYLLYALFYGEDGCRRYAAEARRWASHWAPKTLPRPPVRAPGRVLRVGYVAPSFTRSQLRQFVLPVLQAHDREAVALHLYAADAAAEEALPAHAKVRSIGQLSDEDAAALIRRDRLDILVDLWGHTAGSRLTLFTHRPAPVQAGFVNFNQTTGLDCIDYVLHSDSMATPDADALFTERVWRLGPITVPFLPQAGRPPTTPSPARALGVVTFASFNHPAKLSPTTVRAWAAILQAVPHSRLLLKYAYFTDPVLQRATAARFAAWGVDPGRLAFRGHSTGDAYLAEFADVDLALDPSPCTGGTTTCEALSNGVPVLTMEGEDFFSRIGLQCLHGVEAPELIARDWDDYVARAAALVADLDRLDALRHHVRERFEDGVYGDFAGFTRSLERQYREMVEAVRARARVGVAA